MSRAELARERTARTAVVRRRGAIGLVAGKEFVGAVAGQQHADMLAGLLAQRIKRQRAGIGELAVDLGDDVEEAGLDIGFGIDRDEVLLQPRMLARSSSQVRFRRRRLRRRSRYRPRGRSASEALRDQRAVDAAAQQQRYRHVADELVVDHSRPKLVESVKRLVEVGDLRVDAAAARISRRASRRGRRSVVLPGGNGDDSIDQAARRPGKTLREKPVQAFRRSLRGWSSSASSDLISLAKRSERPTKEKVQRFDPDGIARQDQALVRPDPTAPSHTCPRI